MAKLNLKKTRHFFSHHIWHVKLSTFPKWQRWFIYLVRIIILGVKGYNGKNLGLRASALTMYSVLSIVPVVAMIFGIAQGFGLEAYLTQQLQIAFASRPEILSNLLTYSHNMLSNTKGGLIAGFGLILLIWSVIQVLSNIENSFNSIWFVEKGRTWLRKFTDYLSIMLVAPILIILSGTVNIFISSYIQTFAKEIEYLNDGLENLILFSINLLPYLTTSVLFFLVYLVMPNTRIKPKSALTAGIITGVAFQIFQWAYIAFQIGISKYNGIYGSFASIPLFITWLQYSWIIVLIGAEISYCVQNVIEFEGDIQTINISHKMRMLYSLYIMNFIAKRFKNAMKAPDLEEVSKKLDIPQNLCRALIDNMIKSDLISETIEENKVEHSYVPGLDISHLSIGFIINKLESLGDLKRTGSSETLHLIKVKYNDLEHAMNSSNSNLNIVDF
jgi:membrane protein